jgi:hypothetical protein
MNLFFKSYLIFISCVLNVSPQVCTADVFIQTDVDSANLFVNNYFESQGKNFSLKLVPGTYTITIIDDYKKWNTSRIDDTLRINECKNILVKYILRKKILIDSDPQNAYVKESDTLIGFTPFLIEDNFKSLIVQKPGYSDKIVTAHGISTYIKPVLEFTGEIKGESFYESTIFKVLAGTLIVLGATTAYYKLEADKIFNDYQFSGDQTLLDQTEKYDRISAVTFVAMQINFGLILYLFLSD